MIRSLFGGVTLTAQENYDPFNDGSGLALYRFESNVLDESGNYNGTATNLTYNTGISGQAAVFNGTSSKVTFSAVTTANASSFWTNKPLEAATLGAGALLSSPASSSSIVLGNQSGGFSGETLSVNIGGNWIYITTVINNTSWKHIVINHIGSNVYSMVVNGVSVTVNVYTSPTINFINTLSQMGVHHDSSSQWLNGAMDQVRFFNRALTLSESQTLYTLGA